MQPRGHNTLAARLWLSEEHQIDKPYKRVWEWLKKIRGSVSETGQISETACQRIDEPRMLVDPSQKQRSSLAAQITPGKIHRHFSPTKALKSEAKLLTLCHSEVVPVVSPNTYNHKALGRQFRYFYSAV